MDAGGYAEALDRHGRRLGTSAAGTLHLEVPSCPGWTVADLVWHVVGVHRFWLELVDGVIDDPRQFQSRPRPTESDLIPTYESGLAAVTGVLAGADPEAGLWTWAEDHTVGFVQRRMAQETAVHAWDAGHAAGAAGSIEADLAADGIDEFLDVFVPATAPAPELAGGLHLHATDGDGEWLLWADEDRWHHERRHAKGAFAARASTSNLLLLLWGRVRASAVDHFGDPGVLDALHAAVQRRGGRD